MLWIMWLKCIFAPIARTHHLKVGPLTKNAQHCKVARILKIVLEATSILSCKASKTHQPRMEFYVSNFRYIPEGRFFVVMGGRFYGG